MVLIFELARWQATRSWVLCFAAPCGCFIGFWPLRAAGTRWSSWKWSGVGLRATITSTELITLKADSHIAGIPLPCRAAKALFRMCLSHLIYTVRPCLIHTCHAMPCSGHAVPLKATAQHGRRETACWLPARLRLLPATTRSSAKIVIRSIPILLTTILTYDCKEW